MRIYRELTGSRFPFNEEKFREKMKPSMEHGHNPHAGHGAAVGASPNRLNRLKEIRLPTLVVHGSEDPLVPLEHGLAVAVQIEGSEVMIMEGIGHELPIEFIPELTNRLVSHFNSINN